MPEETSLKDLCGMCDHFIYHTETLRQVNSYTMGHCQIHVDKQHENIWICRAGCEDFKRTDYGKKKESSGEE